MKQILKMMKPFDYILSILALFLSFLPLIITHFYFQDSSDGNHIAIVKIHGEVVDEFELSPDGPNIEEIYYPNDGQYNIVEVNGDKVRVKEDNSPDQIAVKTGWISQPGQVSVCLPHNLIVEVHGQTEEASDPLILPHQ